MARMIHHPETDTAPAVFVLTASAMAVARRIAEGLPSARVHGLAGRVEGAEVAIDDVGAELRRSYMDGIPIVGVCAAGILIRSLARVIGPKETEPPVVAVSEDGAWAVPLLGGHRGANKLASRIADLLGGDAAVTTAGEVRFGVALDDPPSGWHLANRKDAKAFMAALLDGATIRLEGAAPWLTESDLPFSEDGILEIVATHEPAIGNARRLVYHPSVLVLGVGCERDAVPDDMIRHVRATLAEAGLAEAAVACVTSIDLKSDEPAIHALAAALGRPARFFTAAELERQRDRLVHPSEAVYRAVGCHGVAEGAALMGADPAGKLIVPKHISGKTTCAIALSGAPIDPQALGQEQGRLAIIGIGPGARAWRTPEADAALAAATDLVGFRLYLDLVADVGRDATSHVFELGAEVERARHALNLAAEGKNVALISSGDAGIYAMASVLFEVLEGTAAGSPWRRVAVEVMPGISAMQAAAARVGAPIGHDFCAISLSDLLTPWPVIERRVRAAADGDFVLALYNPTSRRRTWQLSRACEILAEARPPDTPVAIARNLGRNDETRTITTLRHILENTIDMLTVIIIGSSATRIFSVGSQMRWMFTPRGYGLDETGGDAEAENK